MLGKVPLAHPAEEKIVQEVMRGVGWETVPLWTLLALTCAAEWVMADSCFQLQMKGKGWALSQALPGDCLFHMGKTNDHLLFFKKGGKKLKYTELWSGDEITHCVK